jgi:hypothetical protein
MLHTAARMGAQHTCLDQNSNGRLPLLRQKCQREALDLDPPRSGSATQVVLSKIDVDVDAGARLV